MKTVFDASAREEITRRITSLTDQNGAEWGKMNVFQMVKHGVLCEDMMKGRIEIKRVLIGRLIGPRILRKTLKDETPFGKNSPTSPVLKTLHQSGEREKEKSEWIGRIQQYADFRNTTFVHPFFGPMTKEQIGRFVYKHADHHLRQFGA